MPRRTARRGRRSETASDGLGACSKYQRSSSSISVLRGVISWFQTTCLARWPMSGNCGGTTIRSVHAGSARSSAAWRSRNTRNSSSHGSVTT